jgi:hypothetical protein
MAAITLTIQVHERGSIREFQIYDPVSRYIGCEFKTDDTDLTLYFDGFRSIPITFSSVNDRGIFLIVLTAGLDGIVDFTLTNLGPVATTTTTTVAP